MPMTMPHSRRKGQTAMEYLLLLGVVVGLVLIAFKTQLPRTRESANIYFNRATLGIIGEPNPCGDGLCCPPFEDAARCPPDCDVSGGGVVECPGAVCTNPFDPTNYTVCSGSDAGLIASESWALVANGGCTGGKCEYQCNAGFMPSGDICVPAVCSGPSAFNNATMCAGSDTGLTVPTTWVLMPNGGCTGAKCQFECNAGYLQVSSVDCVPAQCIGLGFANATICPGDGTGLTVDVPRTLVAGCSPPAGPKCEYTCDGSYVVYSGACCLPACPFGSCGTQNDGCGGTISCGNCCGNGAIDGSEQCDGSNLNGQNCLSQGYDNGILGCSNDCMTFNTSGCYSCGDGACNVTESCSSCPPDCNYGNVSSPCCGNGVLDLPAEQCEGSNLNGQSCTILGLGNGTLACDSSCSFNTSGCYYCGDTQCNGAETCLMCPSDCLQCQNFIVTNSATASLHYNVDAYCPGGTVMVGGGCSQGDLPAASNNVAITDSRPIGTTGWHCRTRDIAIATTRTTTAYAICFPLPTGYTTASSSTTASGHYNVDAYCPGGTVMIGGGCGQGDVSNSTAITDSRPIGTTGWHCRTRDEAVSTSRTTTAYVTCADPIPGYTTASSSTTASGHYNVDAYCPGGTIMIGGGCGQGDVSNSTAITDSRPIGTTGWHCRTRDVSTATSRTTTAYVICAP